jgi:hypothetical protein
VLQLWSARSEQGFRYREFGDADRRLEDFDGVALLTIARKMKKPSNKSVEE